MEKQDGKDYFGFEGQAQSYAKYRPQYPDQFLQYIRAEHMKGLNHNVSIDIATGTGFLAKQLAINLGFKKVYGTDISESQLKEAANKYKDLTNIEFHQAGIEELPQFIEKHNLKNENQLDLITFGQSIHWMPLQKTLETLDSVLGSSMQQYVLVLAYSKPLIYDGQNLWQRIKEQNMESKGFVVKTNIPTDYQFDQSKQSIQSLISEAYEEMWAKIYPHFRFDRSVIEKFYTPFNFDDYLNVDTQIIWNDLTPQKSIHEVFGYMNSNSAYQCYLEDHKIEKGSNEDPLVILKQKVAQTCGSDIQLANEIKIDFVTPYFCYLMSKKSQ
ncbi:UNKNOWN [Stylonychia lemnae]|uniref:Methyltransferase domain-containing protein n=1 Tax=Stylonychia lemnae TaxID=5949 RepID=A0A078B2B6_STYLE|nr:UNKNOWN [Stylonychia lemnae]|eukprot:CDW88371.1 UNKNOWN [Stylonychia lemnae]